MSTARFIARWASVDARALVQVFVVFALRANAFIARIAVFITRHTLALKYKKYMFSHTESSSGSKDKSKLEFDKPSYDSWWGNLSPQQKGK